MSETDTTTDGLRIRTYRLARDRLGARELTRSLPEDPSVGGLLDELADEYDVDPDDFLVMVNGRNVKQLDGTATPLQDGDDLTLSIGSMSE